MYIAIPLIFLWLVPNLSLAGRNDSFGCPGLYFSGSGSNESPLLIPRNRPVTPIRGYVMWYSVPTPPGSEQRRRRVTASRHHIIPYNVLRDFFNHVVQRSRDHPFELRDFAEALARLVEDGSEVYDGPDRRQRITPDILQQARAMVGRIGRGEVNVDTRRFSRQEFEVAIPAIHRMFTWFAGNIFLGPDSRIRFDDPGVGFEEQAEGIVGERNFNRLRTLFHLMQAYTNNQNRLSDGTEVTMTRIANLLADVDNVLYISTNRQWIPEYDGRVVFTLDEGDDEDIHETGEEIVHDELRKKKRELRKFPSFPDPYCLNPLNTLNLQRQNLMTAETAFKRAINELGFKEKDHASSWKDWYDKCTWSTLRSDGYSMAGFKPDWVRAKGQAYGYTFNDGSFSVGITGRDTKHVDDNWITAAPGGRDWSQRYMGQMFFDKNGRPVAIAISNSLGNRMGTGWCYVYNNGKWEYESKDDWHERRFNGRTESLDPNAPRFLR